MSIRPATAGRPRTVGAAPPVRLLDAQKVRKDFPILGQFVNGKPLIYLDNAATTQKPQAVVDALVHYYTLDNSNVHRGVHVLSERATRCYEEARVRVQHFLNAAEAREIIYVRGATEGINLVAASYGRANLRAGDEVIISAMEHHSNIVPWQLVCEQTGAVLRVVPINDRGEFLLDEYEKLLNPRTRLVAVVHVSNSLGTVNPVREIIERAHRHNVPVLLDGAQAAPHLPVDVRQLDCDFYVLSGHKVYGPTGIGVLYGKARLLERMPPYQGGGDMIRSVTFEKTTFNDLPYKFEAGTPNIAGAIGLKAALDYLEGLGRDAVAAYEQQLLDYATERLAAVPGVRLIGTAGHKAAVLSFVVEDPPVSALDVGTQLDLEGIAVRTGHHCCQPVMDRYAITGTARASLAVYNTTRDVDRFVEALQKVVTEAGARAKRVELAVVPDHFGPAYPAAAAGSPQEAADELAEVFEFLPDWTDRYRYVIELGEKLPPMPAEFKTEANRVRGCQSTVFLAARKRPMTEDVLEFLADSDADIVRGLLAILQRLYSGQHAGEVLDFDMDDFFRRLDLDKNLSMGRRNGLAEMVLRVRRFAAALASPEKAAP